MVDAGQWYFTAEELDQVPSRKNFSITEDLCFRQQSASLIRDIGLKLKVTQQCINTAIVFMHRFCCYHPLKIYHRYHVAQAAIFLAAKVEYQPRKLMNVIAVCRSLLNRTNKCDTKLPDNREIASTLIGVEEVLLSTIGFDLIVEHPHSYITNFCTSMKMPKNILQMCCYVATNTLLYTTLCVQYPPTVVACFCIHLVLKWSCIDEVQLSKNDMPWYQSIDKEVSLQLLETIFENFLKTYKERSNKLIRTIKMEFKRKSIDTSNKNDNTSSSSHSTSHVPPPSIDLPRDIVIPSSSSSVAVDHQSKQVSKNTHNLTHLSHRQSNRDNPNASFTITKMENSNSTAMNLPRDSTPTFKNFRFSLLAPEDTKPRTSIFQQAVLKYNSNSFNFANDSTAIEGFQTNLLAHDNNKPSTSTIGQGNTKFDDERYNLAGHSSWQKTPLSITPTSSSLSSNGDDSFAPSTSQNLQKSSRVSNNFNHEQTDYRKIKPLSSSLNSKDSNSFTKWAFTKYNNDSYNLPNNSNLSRDSTAIEGFQTNFLAHDHNKPNTSTIGQDNTKYDDETYNLAGHSSNRNRLFAPSSTQNRQKSSRVSNNFNHEETSDRLKIIPSFSSLNSMDSNSFTKWAFTKYNNDSYNLPNNSNLSRDSTAIEGFQTNFLAHDNNKPSTSAIGQDDTKYDDERYNLAGHSSWQKTRSITSTSSGSSSNRNLLFAPSTSQNLQKSSRVSNNL